jgi:hypothetical protein
MTTKEEKIPWRIEGFHIDSCNCDWGCPCQFMARPTHGNCEGGSAVLITKGNYGHTSLDKLSVAAFFSYPGAIHEGHGKSATYIDERAGEAQFQALSKIMSGKVGGPMEIYASMCDDIRDPRRARVKIDLNGTKSHVKIEDVVEIKLEPILNPVTHDPFRAIIELPSGFEASRMEQANSKLLMVDDPFLSFRHSNSYASIAEIDWHSPET